MKKMLKLSSIYSLGRGKLVKPEVIRLVHNGGVIKEVVKELKLIEYGNPETSLEVRTSELNVDGKRLKNDDVLVKLVASPINPADVNIIQGRYGVLPESLPANVGNEALFEVVLTGREGGREGAFAPGDLVVPAFRTGWGTWRSHGVASSSIFHRVAARDEATSELYHALATVSVNPPTAYRLLKNFVDLKPGETVIQNGANSGVGQAVIQLAKIFKINLVNIVRKRENQDALNAYLRG